MTESTNSTTDRPEQKEAAVFVRDGEVFANCHDVAAEFKKRPDHVLRDINKLDISPELGRSWFRPTVITDAYGRPQPSFDLTREGFTLLAMGWTGAKAMEFKVRYIQAFNAMETEIRGMAGLSGGDRRAIGGIVKAFNGLKAQLLAVADSQSVLEKRMDDVLEGHDRTRMTIVGFAPMLTLLEQRGVPQKGRGGFVRKCSNRLAKWCRRIKRDNAVRPGQDRGVRIFEIELAGEWFRAIGDDLIRMHKDEISGQGVMQFRPRPVAVAPSTGTEGAA